LKGLKSFEIGIANVDISKPFSEREVVKAIIDAREIISPCGAIILSSPTLPGRDIRQSAKEFGYGDSINLRRLTIGEASFITKSRKLYFNFRRAIN
jgi:hypothetical protein